MKAIHLSLIAATLLLTRAIAYPSAAAQDPARALLDRALAAAGGVKAIERHPVLAWHGTATITVPGRVVRIEGDWRIEPPDRAVVETFEIEKGPASIRTLVLDGQRGWTSRAGQTQPMPPALVASERDQFYLYSLVRLAPLRGREFTLTATTRDAEGRAGLHVRRAGRRDADLYFTADDRLARIVTTVADPVSGGDVPEELLFSGQVSADGVPWPGRIRIFQNGAPFFDLEVSGFRTLEKLDLPPCTGCPERKPGAS